MACMMNDDANGVHLLGLDWGDVGLISQSLCERAAETDNEQVRDRAHKLIDLLDAGTASVLAANLEPGNVNNL